MLPKVFIPFGKLYSCVDENLVKWGVAMHAAEARASSKGKYVLYIFSFFSYIYLCRYGQILHPELKTPWPASKG